ncbi:MAG: protein kinase [Planctomycetaceae bacterium]
MPHTIKPCPEPSELEDLLAGRLPELRHAALEAHILNCSACRDRVDTITEPEDGYLHTVRRMLARVPESPEFVAGSNSTDDPDDTAVGSGELSESQASGIVGNYRLIRKVGQGGMGVVFEAEELRLGRRVALKTLSYAHLLDSSRLKRFHNEARTAASLDNHPNVVTVFGSGVDKGLHYYTMRFIHGHNLSEIFKKLKTLVDDRAVRLKPPEVRRPAPHAGHDVTTVPVGFIERSHGASTDADLLILGEEAGAAKSARSEQSKDVELPQTLAHLEPLGPEYVRAIARLGVSAADALAYAHARGVVHRDVKPSNLMLDYDGRLWVTDFGLARMEADAAASQSAPWMGTIRYMSPEQALGKRGVVDHRSDIYSLGVTLYELLTLTPLWPDESPQELLVMIPKENVKSPRGLNPNIPVDLETIILKALAKDPIDRYATADAFAEDLNRFLEHKPILAKRATLGDRLGKWLKQHPSAIAASLAAVAGLIIVGLIQTKLYIDQTKTVADLKQAREATENSVYLSDIALAANAIHERDPGAAVDYLQRHAGRGFEWNWLYSRCRNLQGPIKISQQPLYRIQFSPSGELAAIAGKDANVEIRETRLWSKLHTIATNQVEVNGLAFSPDGKALATTGDDGTLCVWNTQSWKEIYRIRAHAKEAWGVTYTPDGNEIVTTGTDDKVQFWQSTNGTASGSLPVHADSVDDVKISPDGKLMITSAGDGLFLWEKQSQVQPKWNLRRALDGHKGGTRGMEFYENGTRLITGGIDKVVRDWNLSDGTFERLGIHVDQVQSVAVSPDGSTAASGDRGGVVRTWKLKSNKIVNPPVPSQIPPEQSYEIAPGGGLRWCGLNWDESKLIVATHLKLLSRDLKSGETHEIPLPDPSILQTPKSPGEVHIVDVAKDCLVVLNQIYRADDQSASGWKPVGKLPHSSDEINSVRISPGGETIAVGNRSGRVWIYKPDGTLIQTLEERPGERDLNTAVNPVNSLCFSADGKWLAANSSDAVRNHVNFWNLETYGRAEFPEMKSPTIRDVIFQHRDDIFVTCSGDKSLQFWNPVQRERVAEWRMGNPERAGTVLAITHSGDEIAVADPPGKNATIGIWLRKTERELLHLPGGATSLQFSHNSEKLFAADPAGRMRVWNVNHLVKAARQVERERANNTPIQEDVEWAPSRVAHKGRVYSTCFTRDGKRLVSVGDDGNLQVATYRRINDSQKISASPSIDGFHGFDVAAGGALIAWQHGAGIWRFAQDKSVQMIRALEGDELTSACFNPSGSLIAMIFKNGELQILDSATQKLTRRIQIALPPDSYPDWIAFIPETQLILVRFYGERRTNRFYDLGTGEQVDGIPELSGPHLAVARNRNRIAVSFSREVFWIDIVPGSQPQKLAELTDALDDIAISNDGSMIAGCTTTRSVILWDADRQDEVTQLAESWRFNVRNHREAASAVAFSPDGRTLASGDQSGVLKLWDTATGRQFYDLTRQLDAVAQIRFAPNGRAVYSRANNAGELMEFSVDTE